MKLPIETYIGKTYHSLTVTGLSAGTVYTSQSSAFVDARCECGRGRQRVNLKNLINGSVKACLKCADAGRRDKAARRARAHHLEVTRGNYRKYLELLSGSERKEYDRIMLRHKRCEDCAGGDCASEAVALVMIERQKGKFRPESGVVDADHYERQDFRRQFEG